MAFTPEPSSSLDGELEQMWVRLIEIAVAIEKASPVTNPHGLAYQSACRAADAVQFLRHMLEQEQKHLHLGEEISRRLGKA